MIHKILSVSPEFTTNRNHSFLMLYLYTMNFIGVDKLGALRGKHIIRGQVNNAAHVMFTFNSVIILRLSPLCYRLLTLVLCLPAKKCFLGLTALFVCVERSTTKVDGMEYCSGIELQREDNLLLLIILIRRIHVIIKQ